MDGIKAKRKGFATGFKFLKEGDTLNGYYVGTTDKVINGKPAKEHSFQTDEGTKTVLGQVDMHNQLIENNCLNIKVRVYFTGKMERLKNGNTKKLYDVYFWPNDKYTGEAPDPYPTEDEQSEEFSDNDSSAVIDELPPARATKPSTPAAVPSAARQAATKQLLSGRKASA